tara:strand:- start:1498 stop:1722 length:225 start_codon:yes stop_codon:yes gene_type:complete
MSYIKVEGRPDLCRDDQTQAIVNTDASSYNAYMSRIKAINEEKEKNHQMERDLSEVKSDIDEIKSLLTELLKNK